MCAETPGVSPTKLMAPVSPARGQERDLNEQDAFRVMVRCSEECKILKNGRRVNEYKLSTWNSRARETLGLTCGAHRPWREARAADQRLWHGLLRCPCAPKLQRRTPPTREERICTLTLFCVPLALNEARLVIVGDLLACHSEEQTSYCKLQHANRHGLMETRSDTASPTHASATSTRKGISSGSSASGRWSTKACSTCTSTARPYQSSESSLCHGKCDRRTPEDSRGAVGYESNPNVVNTLHDYDQFYLQQFGMIQTIHIHNRAGLGRSILSKDTARGDNELHIGAHGRRWRRGN